MKKKKIIAMALVAMLSLSGLTGCSDKDKSDFTDKVNNKTSETTKKDDSNKTADKTSESTEKSDKTDSKSEDKSSDDKKSDSASTGSTSSDKKSESTSQNSNSGSTSKSDNSTASKPSNSNNSSGSNKSEETKPTHTHTWVDHTATKQVPRTVHHDAVYETVTIPAVTKWQQRCLGCGQWFDNLDDLVIHAFEDSATDRCGASAPDETREVVITPAHTEKKLVKDAYDETVTDTKTYVDYKYCSVCGQKK